MGVAQLRAQRSSDRRSVAQSLSTTPRRSEFSCPSSETFFRTSRARLRRAPRLQRTFTGIHVLQQPARFARERESDSAWLTGRKKGAARDGTNPATAVRAAEYVRMSTERQEYSTESQTEVIRQFAAGRGIDIVRTYADEGRSGLTLEGRPELQRLLDDVRSGAADFTTILVRYQPLGPLPGCG